MPDYAIGDVQGCFDPLMRLLDHIHFDDKQDRLWFVGDLVNRGPQSLEVLRFVRNLPVKPVITLGNHDLYLLARLFTRQLWKSPDDTLETVLAASDADELGHWLRQQPVLWHDQALNLVMCHAGIAPVWSLEQAKVCARELEAVLAGDTFLDFFSQMYGNEPTCWSPALTGMSRLRFITNCFTRMRFCDAKGCLSFDYKGTRQDDPPDVFPWFMVPGRPEINADLVFGHWAALGGICPIERLYAIDTGCYWGGALTALCLQDKRRFSVP